jgi:hypothetical protein
MNLGCKVFLPYIQFKFEACHEHTYRHR